MIFRILVLVQVNVTIPMVVRGPFQSQNQELTEIIRKISKIFSSRPGEGVPSSPKNSGCPKDVPWETNPWDSWDWDKNRWDSPVILSFGAQVPGTKILGTGSPVPCPFLRTSDLKLKFFLYTFSNL